MRELALVADILDRMATRAVHLGRQFPGESDLVASVLVRLPKIAGCLGAGEVAAAADLVEALVRQINGLIARSPDQVDFVTAMMRECNELGLVGQIWAGPDIDGSKEAGNSSKHRRTGDGILYFRRKGPDGQMVLAESRPKTQSRDFFVRRSEYDRAVKALAGVAVKDPVKFPVLYEAFAEDNEPSEYVLRVLLRFWRSRTPPVVQRERSRYRAVGSATRFRAAAQEAWDDLDEQR